MHHTTHSIHRTYQTMPLPLRTSLYYYITSYQPHTALEVYIYQLPTTLRSRIKFYTFTRTTNITTPNQYLATTFTFTAPYHVFLFMCIDTKHQGTIAPWSNNTRSATPYHQYDTMSKSYWIHTKLKFHAKVYIKSNRNCHIHLVV